jgi:hypothetical protein
MPSYFHLPVLQRAQRRGRRLQLVRQEEGIGLAAALRMLVRRLRAHQLQKALRRGADAAVGPAHQPLRNQLAVHRRDGAQRARDQQARHADAEAAADQLGQQEAFARFQLVPIAEQRRAHGLGRRAAQGRDALLHPHRQAHVAAPARRGQDVGDGFGQVAHSVVALVEQPLVQARELGGVLPQQLDRHRLARLAASQEIHGPRRVLGRRAAEVGLQRLQLAAGGGGLVQFGKQAGEFTHAGPPRLPPALAPQARPAPRPRRRRTRC